MLETGSSTGGSWVGVMGVGGAGDDTLDGAAGDDCMFGGTGDDVYVVDSLADVVAESAGQGSDLVIANVDQGDSSNAALKREKAPPAV